MCLSVPAMEMLYSSSQRLAIWDIEAPSTKPSPNLVSKNKNNNNDKMHGFKATNTRGGHLHIGLVHKLSKVASHLEKVMAFRLAGCQLQY